MIAVVIVLLAAPFLLWLIVGPIPDHRRQSPKIDVERNRALNAAWDELAELSPGAREWHPHLPERPNPSRSEWR